jgi:hypothetical protein
MSVRRPLPDALTFVDVELRRAEPTDAIAVARVHVRSWQAAYRKLMPDDYLDQLRPEDRAKKYDFGNLDPMCQRIVRRQSAKIPLENGTSTVDRRRCPCDPRRWIMRNGVG